jgi:hypothetical protein
MNRLLTVFLAGFCVALVAPGAMASGTLFDNGSLVMDFADQTGSTPISADNDGTYIWTASGGGCNPIGRYNQDGSPAGLYNVCLDFRTLFVSDGGQLYGKLYCGGIYSISQSGVPTFLFNLSDPDCQSSASLNGDDSELYVYAAPTVYRVDATNGNALGSFTLSGLGGNELNYPQNVQMETNAAGQIVTFADGIVSEWDLAGNRIGQCTVPIGTPGGFNTNWSFGVGNDNYVYLYNENTARWEVYDVGLTGGPTATQETTWGQLKALYR